MRIFVCLLAVSLALGCAEQSAYTLENVAHNDRGVGSISNP